MTKENNEILNKILDEISRIKDEIEEIKNDLYHFKNRTKEDINFLINRDQDRSYNRNQYNRIYQEKKTRKYSQSTPARDGFNDYKKTADHPYFR